MFSRGTFGVRPRGSSPRLAKPIPTHWAVTYSLAAGAGAIVYWFAEGAAAELIYSLVAVATVPVVIVGVHRNRIGSHPVWKWFGAALASYVVAEVIRDYASSSDQSVPADVLAVLGYLCQIRGLSLLVRARHERLGRNAAADAVVVGAAAWILAWVFLMEPALSHTSTASALVAGLFQPLAVVIILYVCILVMSDGFRTLSFWMLASSMVVSLFGDFGYAIVVARQLDVDPARFDALYIVAFGLVGGSALHPSMRSITEVRPTQAHRWSTARMTTLSVAMFAPAAAVIGVADSSPFGAVRIVSVLGFTVIATARVLMAIREETRASRALLSSALWDPLTHLSTRLGFTSQLTDLRESDRVRMRATAVALIDLHGFRRVNDSLGHAAGDELLVAVAERLRCDLGPGDALGRLSGDEFGLAFGGLADARDARDRARQIQGAFDSPFEVGGRSLSLSARIGIALASEHDDTTVTELVRCADTALHRAKAGLGPSVVVFTEQMRKEVQARLEIESGLRTALENDEFHLVFQPVVDIATGQLASFEALLRWERYGAAIGPAEFVPVAEANGLILPMGRWALRESIRQFRRWLDEGICDDHTYMAVNLSSRQLDDSGLVGFLVETLRTERVRPDQVCLELTETAMMERVDEAAAIFDRLRQLGIRLAIDDFGTGFSSLGQIKQLPFDIVKVDRAFVTGIDVSAESRELIAAILGLATALGKVVVAEGVETEAQYEVLSRMGFGYAQGFLLARPAVAADIPDRVMSLARRSIERPGAGATEPNAGELNVAGQISS